jgi:hypothetical protein
MTHVLLVDSPLLLLLLLQQLGWQGCQNGRLFFISHQSPRLMMICVCLEAAS